MKLIKMTIVMALLLAYGTTYAQNKISISLKNTTIKKAIDNIDEKLPKINFSYRNNLSDLQKKINKSYTNKTLQEILKDLFLGTSLSYKQIKNTIVIVAKSKSKKRKNKTVSGYIYDKKTGETLIGASVLLLNYSKGVISNTYGFYSITIPEEISKLEVRFLGYKKQILLIDDKNRKDIYLVPDTNKLKEVVIASNKRKTEKISGAKTITVQQIKDIPQPLGEPDIIKALQLQGGVKTITDGASFYYVRGGNFDQNLVLLDEAVLYNPSHLMGFLSVVNGDAIKSSKFYKGYFPSQYSGKLSSVLDIATKDGNNQEFHMNAGVSTIGLRVSAEGPIVKNKASYMVSLRNSWMDKIFKIMGKKDDFVLPSFYDVNTKVNWQINDDNKVYLSLYHGRDKLKYDPDNMDIKWQNTTATLRWNHIYSSKLFSNTSLVYNRFNSSIKTSKTHNPWRGGIDEGRLIHRMNYYANDNHTFTGGLKLGIHKFSPGWQENSSIDIGSKKLFSTDVFAEHKAQLGEQFTLNYGVNLKMVKTLDDKNRIELNDKYEVVKKLSGSEGNKTWFEIEPRVNVDYAIDENNHVFTSYSRMNQYSHSLYPYQNDFNIFKMWVPASNNVKPMQSDIYSIGYGYASPHFSVGLEGYYKQINNQLDYTNYPDLQSKYYERYLRAGKGTSYGGELNIGYKAKKYSIEANYAYSKTKLTTPGINEGKEYESRYDIPHQVNVTGKYQFSKRWQFSAYWKFASGKPFTLPVGTQMLNGGAEVLPIYGKRYNARFFNYHRLDIMFTLLPSPKAKKYKGTFSFGVINAYGKENPMAISYSYNYTTLNPRNQYLFKWFPTLSYQIKF